MGQSLFCNNQGIRSNIYDIHTKNAWCTKKKTLFATYRRFFFNIIWILYEFGLYGQTKVL